MSKGAFKNFTFKNLSFKNKVVMAPESSNSANEEGFASEFHYNHYDSKALNGVGTVVVEATAVSKDGRESQKDLGIWSDKHIKGLKKIASSIKKKESVAGIQLYHSGKMGQAIVSEERIKEKDFSIKEIKNIVKAFKKATKRALKAGFDFVEINGDLITEFLSKDINKRSDVYGGKFENRVRILKEIVKAIRAVLPKEKVLAVRLSADLYETKKDKIELTKLIKLLREEGVDLVNLSTENEKEIEHATLEKVKYKEVVKELPVVEGGLINIPFDDTDILNTKHGLAFLGQAVLRDSYWIINEMKSFVETTTKYSVLR
ncbi:MAG: NADPH dehydrogenase [Sarcina sp.]